MKIAEAVFWTYVLIINGAGLILMKLDKNRARLHRWRIPEKTLFLVAVFLGSPGIWSGMYLFRHKTKHMKFVIGIPLILFLQIMIICLLLLPKGILFAC